MALPLAQNTGNNPSIRGEYDEKAGVGPTRIDGLKEAGLYNRIRTLESPQGLVNRGWQKSAQFLLQQLFGLPTTVIIKAAKDALDHYGAGSGRSALDCRTMSLHLELERRVAASKVEAAITFQSGFLRESSHHPALVGKET